MTDPFPTFPRVDFRPYPLLRTGHLQTCFTTIWSGVTEPYRAQQYVIPTTDDDELVLHDDVPAGWSEGDLVALLAHGLGGCHGSPYMVRAAAKLTACGVRTFRLDLRGCGQGESRARRLGHAGRSEDVAAAVVKIDCLCPKSERIAVGFSLGGNVLLKWLSESAGNGAPGVARALAVSAPIDLAWCIRNLQRRSRRIYDRWFVRCMIRQLQERRDHLHGIEQLQLARLPRTLFDFDDRVTAPLSGFSGADEYYSRCSAAPRLGAIRTPTVLLTAGDDPLIPIEMYQAVRATEFVAVRVVPHGGHVGFFGRAPGDADWHWMDWRVVEFVTGSSGR